MTEQTEAPIERQRLNSTHRLASWFHHSADLFEIDPPYQRGSVWSVDQRRGLVKSFLMGVPVPAIVVTRRDEAMGWVGGGDGGTFYAVVDGKQRIETIRAWFSGELAVPATWFETDLVVTVVETDDGPYVTFDGLSDTGRRLTDTRFGIPVVEASVASVVAEAELYLLLNGAGTAQSDADMANAAHAAGGLR